ncbi:MAG: histone deacetylase family protein [Acidimicrobiales bacterium]
MLVVRSDVHAAHHVSELDGGQLIPSWESPIRATNVVLALEAAAMGPSIAPDPVDQAELAAIHASDYLDFMSSAFDRWVAAGRTASSAMGFCFPGHRTRSIIPDHIEGQLGHYSFALDCSIGEHTWTAALESVAIAQTAAQRVADGERSAFALCRPPGHHATRDQFGGYCYLNNSAAAAQRLRAQGFAKVGIIDVDYHHGNGTQDIFYERGDVVFASIHCDPRQQFPFFLGHADETGEGEGVGANFNYPLPRGTELGAWMAAFESAMADLTAAGVEALVVSLGVDTYTGDPISDFQLDIGDYPTIGKQLAGLGLPTVFVMEGGYATAELGGNIVGVLQGFEGAGASA